MAIGCPYPFALRQGCDIEAATRFHAMFFASPYQFAEVAVLMEMPRLCKPITSQEFGMGSQTHFGAGFGHTHAVCKTTTSR